MLWTVYGCTKCPLYESNQFTMCWCICYRLQLGRSGSNENVIRTVRMSCINCKKWNESGFRPPLCTYRLKWAWRIYWGWWDEWYDTALQTHDSKFEPWRSEVEYATSRSRRLPTILSFTSGWGRNIFVSFKPPRPVNEPLTLAWKTAVLATTLGPPPMHTLRPMHKPLLIHP